MSRRPVPLAAHPLSYHFWKLAGQYGAVCEADLTEATTHIVSHRNDTSKVLCALERGLEIVRPEWISQCVFLWERLAESGFRPAGLPPPAKPVLHSIEFADFSNDIDALLASETSSSDEPKGRLGAKRRHRRRPEGDDTDGESSESLDFDTDDFREELENDLL